MEASICLTGYFISIAIFLPPYSGGSPVRILGFTHYNGKHVMRICKQQKPVTPMVWP